MILLLWYTLLGEALKKEDFFKFIFIGLITIRNHSHIVLVQF